MARNWTPLRDPARAAALAYILWIVWAVIVWNVVFDRVLVLAGRQYVHAASVSAREAGQYLRASDWMRPAISRGLVTATAAAGVILAIGLVAVPMAVRRQRSQGTP